mmetsp:Transcript_10230/g.19627  ORF Transcript_10230/g.19627 Transcript_10230/m.19627 type:complete len:550 (+) Transcript_10230:220-1869(+)|eukprot:scaffold2780_cov174-Amphora_coffeaeformis.AAC.8
MWSALRTDLTEFVNTVKGETAEALNQIDANFPENNNDDDAPSPAEEEALRRMDLEETYTTPLWISGKEETDEKSEEDAKEKGDSADEEAEEEDENEGEEDSEDAKEFVASFSIDSKTDEIALLLDLHPQTLKAHFEKLVPTTVKYEDFWMRYFYRCDAERIQTEWDAEDQAAQKARAQAVQQGLSTVRNLLGGAVKAVVGDEHHKPAGGGGLTMSTNQAAKVAAGYFGSTGRPPFVMNTAVSEDGDDDYEEEEELGWDDDEEDLEGGDEDGAEESVDTEQIEFKDAVTEKLQDDLKQALAERDSLQQTVELQHKEIASLKKEDNHNEEIEKLKTQLFEKDSEIAAIRASMLDSSRVEEGDGSDPKLAGLEAEVQRLTAKLTESETSKADAASKYEVVRKERDQKSTELDESRNALNTANAKIEQLTKEQSDLKIKASTLEADNKNFQDALRTAREKAKEEQSSQAAELANLKVELEKVKAELVASEQRNSELDTELQKTKDALRHSKSEDEAKSVDSPDTVSTGIKIEPPAVEKLDEEAALEDGWDEDW